MSEKLAPIVAAVRSVDSGADAVSIAEALWLGAASGLTAAPGTGIPAVPPGGVDPGPEPAAAAVERLPAQPRAEPSRLGRPLYDMVPGPAGGGAGRRVGIAAAPALPRALEMARAMRPFKKRWAAGRHRQLDVEATVRGYADTGQLVPAFRPAPERWFDAVLVVDRSPGMIAWADVVGEFRRLLAQLGAFRTVRTFFLDPGGGDRVVSDPAGLPTAPGRLRAADGRRLILVFTDCAAPGWQRPDVWGTLRAWSESTPTALVNPVSAKLWDHVGLNLPAARVRAPAPGSRNQALTFRLPPMLWFGPGQDERWLPVPVLGLTPHSLGRFAHALMRCDPAGCEAVLTTAKGRWSDGYDAGVDGTAEPPARALVTSFRRLASPPAHRLAVLAATCERLTLPMLRLIAETAVPEAGVNDVGEVIAGGLLTVDAGEPPFFSFRPGVRELLQHHLHVDDVWHMYEMLSRHVGERTGATDRFPVIFPDAGGDVDMPADAVPFAIASADALRVLGIPARPGPGPAADPVADLSAVRERVGSAADEAAGFDLRRLDICRSAFSRAGMAAHEAVTVLVFAHQFVTDPEFPVRFSDSEFVEAVVGELVRGFWTAVRRWAADGPDMPLCWAALFRPAHDPDAPLVRRAATALNVLLNFELPRATVRVAQRLERDLPDGGGEHLDHRRLVEAMSRAFPDIDQSYLQRWQLLIATLNGDVDTRHGGELADYTQDVVWRTVRRLLPLDEAARRAEVESLDSTTAALGRLLGSPLGASLHFETDEAAIARDPAPVGPSATTGPGTDRMAAAGGWVAVEAVLRQAEADDVPAVVDLLGTLQGALDGVPPLLADNPIARFNQLYRTLIESVLERLYTGGFGDSVFISRLTVELAGRYLGALRVFLTAPRECPAVWAALFAQASQPEAAPLPAVAAGLNAHLNFDLPFALVNTFEALGFDPVDDSPSHRAYLRLNELFAARVPALRRGYLDRWQLLIDTMNGDLDDWWQGELVEYTNNVAWRNAQKLWALRNDVAELHRERDRLDRTTSSLGRLLLSPIANFLQ